MAARNDVSINFELSPRLAEIATGSTEISVQDSHDTLTNAQGSFEGHQYPDLISSAGGENLGGGTTVGLTSTLLNLQYAFEATSPISVGSITNTDPLGITLEDSVATFITDGVKRGDWVINFDDQSVTEVIMVTSETSLMTRGLRDGIGNTFTSTDSYKVWEVAEAELVGGNFVATDENDLDLNPVFPTFGRFISKASASSATSQNQEDIEYGSFQGGAWYKASSPLSVAERTNGNARNPVNNIPAATSIIVNKGLPKVIYVLDNLVLDSGDDISSHSLVGDNHQRTSITINPAAETANADINNATVQGTLDGNATITDCSLSTLAYVNGEVQNCVLNAGKITLGGGASALFRDCVSGVPGASTPEIDCGGSGQSLALRNYAGGMKLSNKTGADPISIDLESGQIILDNTVTNGVIIVRGDGKLIDTAGDHILTGNWNGATIFNETPSVLHDHTLKSIADAVLDEIA